MFGIGDIFKSLVNPSTLLQLATGPAGWASLAMQTIGRSIMQQVIQQLGHQLGLPQSVISGAQNMFSQAAGGGGFNGLQSIGQAVSDAAKQGGLSLTQQGELDRSANIDFTKLVSDVSGSEEFKAAKSGGGGKGFLERIAVALGKALDKKMEKAAALAEQIGNQGDSKQSQLGELNGKLSATTQEISILSQALNNVIKTLGEAQTALARKG